MTQLFTGYENLFAPICPCLSDRGHQYSVLYQDSVTANLSLQIFFFYFWTYWLYTFIYYVLVLESVHWLGKMAAILHTIF